MPVVRSAIRPDESTISSAIRTTGPKLFNRSTGMASNLTLPLKVGDTWIKLVGPSEGLSAFRLGR